MNESGGYGRLPMVNAGAAASLSWPYAVETLEQRKLRHAERSHGPPHPPSPFVARSIAKPHLDLPAFQDLDFRRLVAAGDFSFLDRLGIFKDRKRGLAPTAVHIFG